LLKAPEEFEPDDCGEKAENYLYLLKFVHPFTTDACIDRESDLCRARPESIRGMLIRTVSITS
jgi:hypothetical protein